MTEETSIHKEPVFLIAADGTETKAMFVWGVRERACGVTLQFGDEELSSSESDYFEAMCTIRKRLEPAGLIPRCYGASRHCFPSGMGRDMGAGVLVYKLVLGQPAKQTDLVSIFATGPDVELSMVSEQRAFFDEWIASLGRRTV